MHMMGWGQRPVCSRPTSSHNATPHEQALNVGFRQELTLSLWHRNDGFVPVQAIQILRAPAIQREGLGSRLGQSLDIVPPPIGMGQRLEVRWCLA